MTKITVFNDPGIHSVQAEYHASDKQVCTGISALLYGLHGWLVNCGGPGCATELEPGYAYLTCPRDGADVTAAFNVAIIGLLTVEKAHPDHLDVVVG